MTDDTPPFDTSKIGELRERLLAAWQRGEALAVETLVADLNLPDGDRLELICCEAQLRVNAGQTELLAEFQRRFPEFASVLSRLLLTLENPPTTQGGDGIQQSSLTGMVEIPADWKQIGPVNSPSSPATTHFAPGTGASRSRDESAVRAGRFRVIRPHAEGGLGIVRLASDEELNRDVALKEIKPQFAQDPGSRNRFLLEAEVTGALEHPGIVPVYGLGQYADGRPYYAMRFIQGESLKEAIDRFHYGAGVNSDSAKVDTDAATMLEREATASILGSQRKSLANFQTVEFRKLLGRFLDVCQAIAYAHSRGILHRDLKPGNIMLGKYGETLVVDWGLAKVAGRNDESADQEGAALVPKSGSHIDNTTAGSVIGTPAYMSPEQAAGRLDQFGPSTDVYSLGATLYHLLTGQSSLNAKSGHANQAKSAPEPNVSLSELLRRVQDGEFPPPRAVEPSIPRALEAICLKAMSRQPEQRYQSAEQLVVDLERWLADEPVTAHVEPLTQRARRWGRKHPGWLAGMATTLLVGMMSAAIVAVTVSLAKRSESLARERAETLYYGSQVQTAYREWKQNRGKEMAIALAGVEHANFESELMSSLLNNSRVVVPAPGHFGSILPITYSAATDTLALAGNYAIYCVKLSDLVASATSRPENIVLKLNTDEPNEGNRVRANARELANLRFSRIYKSHSDEEIEEEVEEEEEVSKLVFSSDGMHLFVATEVTTTTRKRNDTGSDVSILIGTGYILRVFEVATGRVIHRHSGLEVDRNHDWTPTPDGNLFLMTNNGEDAAVIDIATGDPLYDFSTSRVAPFAFSPTGNEIATANSRDSDWEVQIRHARTGEVIQEIPAFSENVDALCFNRTGDELIVACGRYLIRWTKRDNRFHRTSKRPHGLTRCGVVSESLSGSFVLAVPHAYDHQFHFNVLSNSRGGLPVSHVGHQGQIEFAAFTGDSKSIVSCGSDGEVRLSPVDSCPRPISKWSGEEYVDAAFSNEGSLATVTDWQEPTIRWIEGRGRKLRRGYERDIPLFYGGKIAERPSGKNFMPDAMAFLQDGTSGGVCMVFGAGSEKTYFLAVGDGAKYMGDATVAIVDLSSGAIAQQNLETGIVGFPCVDPARRYVAFLDGTTLCVWDCRLRETIIKHAFGSSGTCLSFDRLGQKIAVGGYFWKKLGLFDLNDRAPVSVSLPEQNDRADMVVYSPTEDMIAVTDGNRIRLRDARTFRVVRSFSELAREITSLCFTPDGSVLISGCEDGAVTMWNVKFGVPTLTIREQEDKIRKIELSRDGKQMITVSEKEIVYWDLRDPSHE